MFLTLCVSLSGLAQGSQDTVCKFDPIAYYGVPNNPNYVYQWNVNGGQITSRPDSNQIRVDWSGLPSGRYDISVVAINEETGCPGDTSRSSILLTAPKAATVVGPTEVCFGDWVTLESTTQTDFQWEDGSRDRIKRFQLTKDTAVMLIALNGKCANDTTIFALEVVHGPTAGVSPLPDTVLLGDQAKAMYRGNRNGNSSVTVDWYLNGVYEGSGQVMDFTFDTFGKNEVAQVCHNGQCQDTLRKYVFVDDQFTAFFPKAFTPNGDGVNDHWNFDGVGHKEFKCQIFNRWGERVYAYTHADNTPGWDGNEKSGERSNKDTYTYKVEIIDMRGKPHFYNGYFTLVR